MSTKSEEYIPLSNETQCASVTFFYLCHCIRKPTTRILKQIRCAVNAHLIRSWNRTIRLLLKSEILSVYNPVGIGFVRNPHCCYLSRRMGKPKICIGENKGADQRLCFRYTDSTIPLLCKFKMSNLYPSSVTVQPGLCGTWSETQIVGFLMHRLILFQSSRRPSRCLTGTQMGQYQPLNSGTPSGPRVRTSQMQSSDKLSEKSTMMVSSWWV